MKYGKVTENAYKRSVLKQIKTGRKEVVNGAALGEDCAIFSFSGVGAAVCSEQSNGVQPVPAILQKCVNRLAAKGTQAVAVTMELFLPQDAEEAVLKETVREAEAFCAIHRLQLAGVRARVTAQVQSPCLTVSAFGEAKLLPGENEAAYSVKRVRPGQELVVSKWVGLTGTAVLADRLGEQIAAQYPAWLLDRARGFGEYSSTVPEAQAAADFGVCAMLNVSEGGIFAALWELAEASGVGLSVDLKKIPLRQETVEICNLLQANPYELMSDGCLIMTCEDGEALVNALTAKEIPAAVIGRTTDGKDRLILNDDEKRYLDRPQADAIYESLRI